MEDDFVAIDFRNHLTKQFGFLETSCREYDVGNIDEAIRLALAMRVIFHNTTHSRSLLAYLEATTTPMLSTCGKRRGTNPDALWPGFVSIDLNVAEITVTARPHLGTMPSRHRVVPFSAWWDGEDVYCGSGRRIRRNRLICDAANKDGGAHVDPSLPSDYDWMINGAHIRFSRVSPSGEKVEDWLAYPHLACLRQMAFEVLNSPELLKLAE